MEIKKQGIDDYIIETLQVYKQYINTERAIPDYRDGLKPVQRRILWAMYNLNLFKNFTKCARTVGSTIGNYHPHGDISTYEALVKMSDSHSKYPLIQGQGNFGTRIDPPAAYRYTEARLTALSQELFKYMDIVPLVPNFSGDTKEPFVLAALLPILLLNGSEGIGYGKGNKLTMPPHKISDILHALRVRLKGGSEQDVIDCITGPDYYFKGKLISTRSEVEHLYKTGNGTLRYSCNYNYETRKKKKIFVITSIPPGFSISAFIGKCEKLISDKTIVDVVENSQGEDIELIVEYKDENIITTKIIPMLSSYVNYNFVVIDKKKPTPVNLIQLLDKWLHFRKGIEQKYLNYLLKGYQDTLESLTMNVEIAKNAKKILNIVLITTGKERDDKLKLFGGYAKVKNISIGMCSIEYLAKTKLEIKKTNKQIIELQYKLKHIPKLVYNYFTNFLTQYENESRNIEISYGESVIISPSENQIYHVALTKEGRLIYSIAKSSKIEKRKWDYNIEAFDTFTLFYPNNIAKQYSVLDTKSVDPGFIGIISDRDSYFMVISSDYEYLVYKNSNRRNFTVFAGDRHIKSVFPFNTDTVVEAYWKKDKTVFKTYTMDNVKINVRVKGLPVKLVSRHNKDITIKIKRAN